MTMFILQILDATHFRKEKDLFLFSILCVKKDFF